MNKNEAIVIAVIGSVVAIGVFSLLGMILHHALTMDVARMSEQALSTSQNQSQTSDTSPANSVARGQQLVNTQCALCHQQGGVGKIGVAPSIRNRDFLALASDDFIKRTIREGRVGTSMGPRTDLSEQQLDDIIAYLRSLPIPLPLNVKVDLTKQYHGDTAKGKKTYQTYCSACHGQKGEGYIAGGSGPGIGLKGFLNIASDDYIFQTVKHGRVGTAMKSFIGARGVANLTESEIHDVIAFLREQAK